MTEIRTFQLFIIELTYKRHILTTIDQKKNNFSFLFDCEPTPDLVLISAANLRRHGRRKQRRRRAARTLRAWPWSTEALSRASNLGLQAEIVRKVQMREFPPLRRVVCVL